MPLADITNCQPRAMRAVDGTKPARQELHLRKPKVFARETVVEELALPEQTGPSRGESSERGGDADEPAVSRSVAHSLLRARAPSPARAVPWRVQVRDVCEVLAWAAVTLLVIAAVAWLYHQAARSHTRRVDVARKLGYQYSPRISAAVGRRLT